MKSSVLRFYSLLVLLYFSDMVLLLSNVWNSLRVTDSPLFLGITLSIGSALPFLLKKLKIIKRTAALELSELYLRRIIAYGVLLVIALLGYADTRFGFIVTSLSIGYLSLITLGTLEANNARLVHEGHISSEKAARVMQTLVQIGAFVGAMGSGYFLSFLEYNTLIAGLCVFDIVVSLSGRWLYRPASFKAAEDENAQPADKSASADLEGRGLSITLKYLGWAIAIIGLHICAFNTLTPILFQHVRDLPVQYYGWCSGVAGVGAFLAAFVNVRWFKLLVPAVILAVADLVFTMSSVPVLMVAVCFFIGLSMNTTRIYLRKSMIDHTSTTKEANRAAAYSSTLYVFSQSVGPLVLGILTHHAVLGSGATVYLFPLAGVLVIAFACLVQQRLVRSLS